MPLAIVAGVGAAIGGIASFAGQSSQNSQARAQASRQNEYQKDVYEFQWGSGKKLGGEALRQYEYAVEGLEITKRNNEANLQFQEFQSVQRYNYDMGIRAYEFAQANRVYDQSVSRAVQQQSFNELATQAALTDQGRLYHEQMIGLAMDETQTLFNYGMAAAGVGLKKRSAKLAAVGAAQQQRVAAMKATGASQARGMSGRAASKNIQGMLAESGAMQRSIVDKLMFDTEATDQELFKMNQQLVMDQVGFEFSKDSARLSNVAALNKIKAQSLQAAISAAASIALKPEIAPPMPRPIALPRPEYQDVYKPEKPPEPMENVAMTSSPFLAGLSGAISGAQSGLSIGTGLGLGK
jgi:hypothetical protein